MQLQNKVAFITGAGLGIGRAIAIEMAKAGASVIVTDINLPGAEETVAMIKRNGGKARSLQCDVSRSAQVDDAVEAGLKALGKIDILVNNAGVNCTSPEGFLELTDDEWQHTIDINLNGPFYCCRAVLPNMVERKEGGKIINISSVQAFRAHYGATAYQPSKGALTMLTKSLAIEFAPYKINVNAIAPGAIASEGIGSEVTPEEIAAFRRVIPLGARGYTRDIATVAVFLASEASRYMTGQTLVVDGGYISDSTPVEMKEHFHEVAPDDPDK